MSEHLLLQGVNVVIDTKRRHGMTASWLSQVGYEQIIMLLGSQSITGNSLLKGDKLTISALSKEQIDIANHFGNSHSNMVNKFDKYVEEDGSIPNSSVVMFVEVMDKIHLPGIEDDNLIYCKVNKTIISNNNFLSLEEVK